MCIVWEGFLRVLPVPVCENMCSYYVYMWVRECNSERGQIRSYVASHLSGAKFDCVCVCAGCVCV